jgi:hypothetical protein
MIMITSGRKTTNDKTVNNNPKKVFLRLSKVSCWLDIYVTSHSSPCAQNFGWNKLLVAIKKHAFGFFRIDLGCDEEREARKIMYSVCVRGANDLYSRNSFVVVFSSMHEFIYLACLQEVFSVVHGPTTRGEVTRLPDHPHDPHYPQPGGLSAFSSSGTYVLIVFTLNIIPIHKNDEKLKKYIKDLSLRLYVYCRLHNL